MVSPSNKRKFVRGKPLAYKEDKKPIKRKLPYKPLLSKRFYLDANNYSGITNLKRELSHLGAVIEDFLVKDIDFVITSRKLNQIGKGSSSEAVQQPSPSNLSPLSPSTPQPLSSIQSASCDSPNLPDSYKEDSRKKIRTRAEVLLERACIRKQGTSDVLENARLWAIPVWSLSKLLRWVSNLKESPLYCPPRNTVGNHGKGLETANDANSNSHSAPSSKSQKLKDPFIKVEGFKRDYRPHFKELKKWPSLNLSSNAGVSPFADPKQLKPEKGLSSKHRDLYPGRKRVASNRRRFCELCSTNYSNLRLHLQSESHLTFVRNKDNYANLDQLISEYDIKKK